MTTLTDEIKKMLLDATAADISLITLLALLDCKGILSINEFFDARQDIENFVGKIRTDDSAEAKSKTSC